MPSLRARAPRLIASIALLGALAVTLSACSTSPSATPSPSATATPGPVVMVDLEEFVFVVPGGNEVDGRPALTVSPGTTVTFTNVGAEFHTASHYSDGFDAFRERKAAFHLAIDPGKTGRYVFTEPGTYYVGCVPHQGMEMVVIVE